MAVFTLAEHCEFFSYRSGEAVDSSNEDLRGQTLFIYSNATRSQFFQYTTLSTFRLFFIGLSLIYNHNSHGYRVVPSCLNAKIIKNNCILLNAIKT
ncbi:hypothetical protein LMH87_000372 [Akanthomyces muscarius]|uniref:Uncharacterized protein n=1 Tax=Akanthomyces muscarius TaxID=2231603 RepID=A0A9W8QH75_AKAMU|nr:hypothetical protein LMH87_000372 [Akanthomyces muscarius]KAJ4155108.1 hypothetical protein LMH87_000372 [Akanthomyces muscarius]